MDPHDDADASRKDPAPPHRGDGIRRFLSVWMRLANAADYSAYDATLDRIERLAGEVEQLRQELRELRVPRPGDDPLQHLTSRESDKLDSNS